MLCDDYAKYLKIGKLMSELSPLTNLERGFRAAARALLTPRCDNKSLSMKMLHNRFVNEAKRKYDIERSSELWSVIHYHTFNLLDFNHGVETRAVVRHVDEGSVPGKQFLPFQLHMGPGEEEDTPHGDGAEQACHECGPVVDLPAHGQAVEESRQGPEEDHGNKQTEDR